MDACKTIFVVSDIHGHDTLLKEALGRAGFDWKNESHLLVCCGDYFDRGNENVEVLKFFERLERKVLLRGNHEDLLLSLLQTGRIQPRHRINGTVRTLENFFGKCAFDLDDDTIDFSGNTRTVDRLCDFIEQTISYYELGDYVFIHGWLPESCASPDDLKSASEDAWQAARKVRWTDKYTGKPPLPGKTLVCGHMPTFYAPRRDPNRPADNAGIFYGNGLIAIDAGTYDSKQVNVLVLQAP